MKKEKKESRWRQGLVIPGQKKEGILGHEQKIRSYFLLTGRRGEEQGKEGRTTDRWERCRTRTRVEKGVGVKEIR